MISFILRHILLAVIGNLNQLPCDCPVTLFLSNFLLCWQLEGASSSIFLTPSSCQFVTLSSCKQKTAREASSPNAKARATPLSARREGASIEGDRQQWLRSGVASIWWRGQQWAGSSRLADEIDRTCIAPTPPSLSWPHPARLAAHPA
jgi:hypothetical protein